MYADGRLIACCATLTDPSAAAATDKLHLFVPAGHIVRGAHAAGSDITCLRFSMSAQSMLSRSEGGRVAGSCVCSCADMNMLLLHAQAVDLLVLAPLLQTPSADGTLKLWDLRKFKAPVAEADGLSSNYSMTQVRPAVSNARL